jgi:outer membrane protein assembly factor BamB
MRRPVLIGLGLLALSGCSWFEEEKAKPLEGERIPVLLSLDQTATPDPRIADLRVRLPKPDANSAWAQSGGTPNHAMQHLAANGSLDRLFRVSIGSGTDSERVLLAQPVIADGRAYTVDVEASVRAFDAATGRQIWRRDLRPDEDDEGMLGGGIGYARGRLYVTTGFAQVIALDAANGEIAWRRTVSGPMRSPPTIFGGRVFAITLANQLHVLAADDGRPLWNHASITETAGLVGGAGPAVDGDVVVAPFSSGELVALRTDNGRVLWSETLSPIRRTDPVSSIPHIKGGAVIDRGTVYAVSHSGRMVAIDLRTGSRVWEQPIGGTQIPWVAGEFVYVLSSTAELVCLARRDGRIRWVVKLQRYEDEEKRRNPIVWSGPVLAGDRLLVVGSNREVWSLSPYTGERLGRIKVADAVFIQPAVANETVYILSSDAQLTALK